MRVLFLCNDWHIKKDLTSWLESPELEEAGHHFVRCVAAPLARKPHIGFDLTKDTIHDIAAQFPGGPPDLMLVWEPGWLALPRAIEEAPFPVVALLSDWNLTIRPQIGMLDAFDYLFTDRPGVNVVKRLGYDKVEYWPMWGHDPQRFHRIPGVERIWDVSMIGNLSSDVQRERSRWLYRLCKMGDRWKIRIAGGLYGQDYLMMLNQSKITFNRSIRREFNMRCYEAAACGSLLFYDEENEEVRDYFEDRVHCVLYNEHNFEELIDYYLTHDDERQAIVTAAQERIQEISQPEGIKNLLGRIEDLGLLSDARPARPFNNLPENERRKRYLRQVFHGTSSANLSLSTSLASEALRHSPTDASVMNDYSVIAAYLALAQRDDFVQGYQALQSAVDMAKRAIAANPDSALPHINLGQICKRANRLEEAKEHFLSALQILEDGDKGADDLLELYFPFEHNQFRTQYETLHALFAGSDDNLRLARRCLLIYETGMALGEIFEVQGQDMEAGQAYQTAALARQDLGSARAALARSLRKLGQTDDAIEQLQIVLSTDPFLSNEWLNYIDLLTESGRISEAQAFIEEHLIVIGCVPAISYMEAPLRKRLAALSKLPADKSRRVVKV